jgi:dipeptidase E
MKKLLLISNSTQSGSGFLDHCAEEIKDFLGKNIENVLFIPFALGDLDGYAEKTKKRFYEMGYKVTSLHETNNPIESISSTDAIFIGGGNTFRLLNKLYELNILSAIRNKVESGAPYIGTSAGSNVACVTIKTTNDMPIIFPPSFDSLNLVPFNINAHFIDSHPENHQGETREQRIKEFHELNDNIVVGLREGTMLRIEGEWVVLKGITSARIFKKKQIPYEVETGSSIDFLLK